MPAGAGLLRSSRPILHESDPWQLTPLSTSLLVNAKPQSSLRWRRWQHGWFAQVLRLRTVVHCEHSGAALGLPPWSMVASFGG